MQFKVLQDPEKNKEELKSIWDQLPDHKIPSGFSLERIIQWWQIYRDMDNNRFGFGKTPCIIVGTENGRVRCVLPLMITKRKKFRYFFLDYLEFYSQSLNAHTLDIIGDNLTKTDILQLFSYISRELKFDIIQLSYLPEKSIIAKTFNDHVRYHAGKVIVPAGDTYENIRIRVYSKNLRHNLNKYIRRINSPDKPVFFEVLDSKEQIEKYKKDIIDISLSKLRYEKMHSIYEDKKLGEKYFRSMMSHPGPYCAIIRDDQGLLSYIMGYVENSVAYALDSSYNKQFGQAQKISMGILACDQLVKHFAGKVKHIDLGPGLIDYKFRFSKHIIITCTLLRVSNTLKGFLFKNRLNKQHVRQHESVMEIINKYGS